MILWNKNNDDMYVLIDDKLLSSLLDTYKILREHEEAIDLSMLTASGHSTIIFK